MIRMVLTSDNFGCVDMEYSFLHVAPPRDLGTMISFELWGILFHTKDNQLEMPGLPFSTLKHNFFVNEWATVVVHQPIAFQLQVTLYDASGKKFIRDKEGSTIHRIVNLTAPDQATADDSRALEYPFGGVSIWPCGDCALSILAKGQVHAELPVDACLPVEEFCRLDEAGMIKRPLRFG